jgi:hypothetical protein
MRESGIMRAAYRIRIRPTNRRRATRHERSRRDPPPPRTRRLPGGTRHRGLRGTGAAPGEPGPAPAATPIELSQSDVFFISRWFRGTQTKTWSALCGFAVHGNLLHPLPPGAPSAYRINSPLELNTQDPFSTHE